MKDKPKATVDILRQTVRSTWDGKKNPKTMAKDSKKWTALTTLLKTNQIADKSFTVAAIMWNRSKAPFTAQTKSSTVTSREPQRAVSISQVRVASSCGMILAMSMKSSVPVSSNFSSVSSCPLLSGPSPCSLGEGRDMDRITSSSPSALPMILAKANWAAASTSRNLPSTFMKNMVVEFPRSARNSSKPRPMGRMVSCPL
mmetsp:Transcript_5784/g.13327  ORF Transcript_5784/g.13327 Transcript_5784/m.13327 type:complete len:200 (+) Transcript_5784:749-1348(+)